MRTMGRRLTLAAAIAVGAAVAAGAVIAGSADDDLTVVKRAVRVSQDAAARVAPAPPAPDDSAIRDETGKEWRSETRHTANRDLRWFKVRVTEKGSKRSRVSINLPIALVRALDDFPIDIGRHGGWHDGGRTLRLGEVLATLEGGQSLVEIDDDEATVRVWVE